MTEPKQRRKPRKYTDEFKQQLVELSRKNRIKDGAGLLNPLSYYLVKVGI